MTKKMPSLSQHLVVALLLAVACGQELERKCTSSKLCEENECCLNPILTDPILQNEGICSPRGNTNETCYMVNNEVEDLVGLRPVYNLACPCKEGYTCEKTGVVDEFRGELGACVKWCNTQSDCSPGECCSALETIIERHKREASIGQCKKLGTIGSLCYVQENMDQELNFICPCDSMYECQGNGEEVGIFGETGNCTEKDYIARAIPGK